MTDAGTVVAATVDGALAGSRLDVAVARVTGSSRSRAAAAITAGRVSLDGRGVSRSTLVRLGQVIEVAPPPPSPSGGAGVAMPPIRWRDEHLLVVAKPAGLVVHPGIGHAAGTLVQVLADAAVPLAAGGDPDRPGIVHRLDKDTSGLMVVASSTPAYDGLVAALAARTVRRRYLAMVDGAPPGPWGRVDAPIGRDDRDRTRFAVTAGGRPAVTHWRCLDTGRAGDGRVTLVGCRLETGRTHQIRVHLAHAGCPVAGDRRYGASAVIADRLTLRRPFLHATELAFDHPVTGRQVHLREPLPDDLIRVCAAAGVDPASSWPEDPDDGR